MSAIKLKWSNPNRITGCTFIYKSRLPFDLNNLPQPYDILHSTLITEYEDKNVKEGESFWYLLAFGTEGNKTLSEPHFISVPLKQNAPRHLKIDVLQEGVLLRWEHEGITRSSFNIYRSSSNISNNQNLEPIAKEIVAKEYLDRTANTKEKNFFQVSTILDNEELFSNEVEVSSKYPYQVTAYIYKGILNIRWSSDYFGSATFNYYCENSPIDEQNFPEPKATKIKERSFSDLVTIDFKNSKFIRIGAVIDGNEYISDEYVLSENKE